MSTTTVKLLQAASEIVGGDKALAERLGVSEALLAKFLRDLCELPDPLLLRAVDLILAVRHPEPATARRPLIEGAQGLRAGRLSGES